MVYEQTLDLKFETDESALKTFSRFFYGIKNVTFMRCSVFISASLERLIHCSEIMGLFEVILRGFKSANSSHFFKFNRKSE